MVFLRRKLTDYYCSEQFPQNSLGRDLANTALLCRGSSRSGGAPSQLTSTFVREMLSSGFLQEYIHKTLRPTYARRYRIVLDAITDNLPQLGFKFVKADHEFLGGYFIWLKLPPGIKASHLAAKASELENLLIGGGTMFQVEGDTSNRESRHDLEQYVRLCFAYEEEMNLEQGVERLAKLVKGIDSTAPNRRAH